MIKRPKPEMMKRPREVVKDTYKVIDNDFWPIRDEVCSRSSYSFRGADTAIKRCRGFEVVIQAGGCVGTWPRYLRTFFSKVYTFESSIENYGFMLHNLGDLDIVKRHAALSDKVGKCSIKLNPRNCGDDQTVEGDTVDTVTIDSLDLLPDLIYLDIQGDEYRALKGAEKTLERCSPVIGIEVDNKLSRIKGDAVGLLKEYGYVQFAKVHQDLLFERLI